MKYQVIDRVTKDVKGIYKNRNTAAKKRDKLDNDYGCYRYVVVTVVE